MKQFTMLYLFILILAVSCSSVEHSANKDINIHQARLKEPVRCVAITLKGQQCKRTTYDIDSLCWQHK